MNPSLSYLPQDRLRALARGEPLPDRASGAALFADISGFTPLTEALARELQTALLAHDIGYKEHCVYGLSRLAAAVGPGQPQRATRLAAASETLRLAIGLAREPAERRIYERTLAATRAALSEAEFIAAWAEGETMTLDEAVAYALSSEV